MLPPGTLKALKGHPDSIVTVVTFAIAVGAVGVGVSPWPVVGLLSVGLLGFHIRSCAAEHHKEQMAQLKVDEAAVSVEMVKARHRELLTQEQPGLPLERKPRSLAGGRSGDEGTRR
jgi:hypothetical protein